jgi:hypothetical protein
VGVDPGALGEFLEQRAIESAGGAAGKAASHLERKSRKKQLLIVSGPTSLLVMADRLCGAN